MEDKSGVEVLVEEQEVINKVKAALSLQPANR
jgi:hypothetical protein